MNDKDKLELLKAHVNDNYKVGSEHHINLQKLKDYVNEMSAVGLMINQGGFNKLSELIKEHHNHVGGLPMDKLIQFVYNEGAKAGAQQINILYRNFIGDKQ